MTVLEHRRRLAAPERRQQILDAATRLFVARGFEAVSMADIAGALGVSRPAVYSYFASTGAVLDVLLTERLGQLWTHLERLIPASGVDTESPPVGLYATLFAFLLGERESLLLLHSGGGPAFQARRRAFLAELGERLEARYPNIRRRPYQMTVVTHLLDSLAFLAVQQELEDVQKIDIQGLAATLDSFMRGGVARLAQEAGTLPVADALSGRD
ncbi:TetR/AcrR family transcriptional regulator [Deinococcus altitudinis]|uniref:TetR/AcrR family transcriptional regulator n=1 Tax=Deinococcus altitudinis TaxID=468914 RepID=UPI0038924778